ncbi:MAG: PAS domain-containing protein [Phycisphaerales bacterium]|nr:PAS domain-containing protein [Phycisphaerales bacterium]
MPSSVSWRHSSEIPEIITTAGALVAFMGEDLRCKSISAPFAAITGHTPEQLIGARCAQCIPPEMAAERDRLFQQVLSTGKPVQFLEAVGGGRYRATFSPATLAGSHERGVVIILTPLYLLPPGSTDHLPFAQHNHNDPLEGLTRAETELLSLIGSGLSTQQIARKLHRSVKTIESHRASLGRKLNVTNRVELALIAVRAGLVSLVAVPGAKSKSGDDSDLEEVGAGSMAD